MILARGEEEGCWCMENIEMSSNSSKAVQNGYHISTDNKSVDEVARIVLEYIGA